MMQLVDLSHPLQDGQLVFPQDPLLRITPFHTVESIGYNLCQISLSSHQGTHLDAPFHFFNDGTTLDAIPLEKFYGPAALIDLAPGGCLPPKTPLTVAMFEPHAAAIREGARIVYRTGWDRMFNTPEFFADYPTLTLEAAQFFADRKIGLIGMDTPTPSNDWKECHHILLRKGLEIVIVEGLANLDRLPSEFTLIAFPLNVKGRDGSPIRAVGMIES